MPTSPDIDPYSPCPDPIIESTGYPTEDFLQWLSVADDHKAIMRAVLAYFSEVAYGSITRVYADRVSLATGGWSGCEDVIASLHDNVRFWHDCWEEQHRGGKWVFEVEGLQLPGND
jgi:hypothetical protein